jgi:hypothetical protein
MYNPNRAAKIPAVEYQNMTDAQAAYSDAVAAAHDAWSQVKAENYQDATKAAKEADKAVDKAFKALMPVTQH